MDIDRNLMDAALERELKLVDTLIKNLGPDVRAVHEYMQFRRPDVEPAMDDARAHLELTRQRMASFGWHMALRLLAQRNLPEFQQPQEPGQARPSYVIRFDTREEMEHAARMLEMPDPETDAEAWAVWNYMDAEASQEIGDLESARRYLRARFGGDG